MFHVHGTVDSRGLMELGVSKNPEEETREVKKEEWWCWWWWP